MIQVAEPDIISPAIAPDNPNALLDEGVGDGQQITSGRKRHRHARASGAEAVPAPMLVEGVFQAALQVSHALALEADARFSGLVCGQKRLGELMPNGTAELVDQLAR